MFESNTIWAYPTDTSFGLGVRCDDLAGLQALKDLKQRPEEKWFSLMVRDWEMLKAYAEIPEELTAGWFFETPRTALLKPTSKLPKTGFWPNEKVAFRICTLPEIAKDIEVPITATSANITGAESIFCIQSLFNMFGAQIKIPENIKDLPDRPPSEIWDWTTGLRIR